MTRVGIDEQHDRVFAELESGKQVHADVLLYAVGRQANGASGFARMPPASSRMSAAR